jgi:hypothetical protein
MNDANPINDPLQRVVELTRELETLRQRVKEIDGERVAAAERINVLLAEIAAISGRHAPPPAGAGVAQRILWILRRHRDRPLSPAEVGEMLGYRHLDEFTNVRLHLSRMHKKAWVRRVGHGRYLARD